MRVEYHPLTVSDLNNAVGYYNQQRAGLGDELRAEAYAAIERARGTIQKVLGICGEVRLASV